MSLDSKSSSKSVDVRNMISFWLFGLCNNFTFNAMLNAAQDILSRNEHSPVSHHNNSDVCVQEITSRICSTTSVGVVLICCILPALLVKIVCPFVMHRIPYGIRHFFICSLLAAALLVTALADSSIGALLGVCMASLAGGFGETTYLGLAGHYSKNAIAAWSSGTGMAGLAGAFSYAGMTDARLLAFTSTQAMLVMISVPAVFAFTYYVILVRAPTVRKVNVFRPREWFRHRACDSQGANNGAVVVTVESSTHPTFIEQLKVIKGLMRYMVPLFLVYVAEFLINQGVLELIVFDCDHGFRTSPASQYRWFQVMYQIGVFLSRSSINFCKLNMTVLLMLPVLQLVNLIILSLNAIYAFIPSFAIVCCIILYEGLIGGGSYVNTFHHIHRKVELSIREIAFSTVTLADSFGILIAALAAIPLHNAICAMPFYPHSFLSSSSL